MANQAPKPKKQRESFFEAILNKAEDTKAARGGRPDPWLERKFAVSLAVGIVGWTVYVVIVRICVPMLQQRSLAGSRGRGIAFLIIFVLLLLMFFWTYFRVVLSSPGVVRDYVTQAEVSADPYSRYSPEPLPPSFRHSSEFAGSPAQVESAGIDSPPPAPESSDRAESSIAHAVSSSPSPAPLLSPPPQAPDQPVAAPAPSSGPVQSPSKQSCCPPPLIATRAGEKRALAVEEARGRDGPNTWERQPPQPEILGRWCGYCEVARPPRAHHCRICGTCVLNMDHHCPWVGVCIGQQNHKYFLNFTYWSTVFTIFCLLISAMTFGTLYINGERDKETLGMIGSVIGISTFFSLLTIAMAGSHTYLILINMSTIESYALRPFHARESALLSKQHGPLPTPARRRTLRSLEREWGRVTHEGNRWWLGTRRNWQDTMGTNPLGWVFPIAGKGVNKGLVWETNPRVGPDGWWRRRSEWPEELR